MLVYSYLPLRQYMNWLDAWLCGLGMLAPLANLISAIEAPVRSSRQSIFSATPASDFSRHSMVAVAIRISSREGAPGRSRPVGVVGDVIGYLLVGMG
ncbi:hypothetical protein D3C87_1675760 [compost metagenome]